MYRIVLTAWLLLLVACGGADSEGTTPTTAMEVRTTTTAVVSTTGAAAAPTTAVPTTVAPGEAEGAAPTITLAGAPRVYSVDGSVLIAGWIDREAQVTVAGAPASVLTDPDGRTDFSFSTTFEPGSHQVEVVALGATGGEAVRSIEVVVDPTLEQELAYVDDLDGAGSTLVADYVQFLAGAEAVTAAREDGFIGAEEELPSDYYIRNQNTRLRTLEVAENSVIVLQACYVDDGPCVTQQAVDFGTWTELAADPESAVAAVGWNWYGAGALPCWLTLSNGVVVQVEELYLP